MKILNLFKIIFSYRKYCFHVIFFEIFYFFKGYKNININILNHEKFTDNIPCSYFFLFKIKKFLLKKKIKSMIDLGCGGGRSIYFLNKDLKIKYYGLEYHEGIYNSCKNLFNLDENVKILNEDFMSLNFLEFNCDCFFINDPLRNKNDFDKLIQNILKFKNNNSQIAYFILVNVDKDKREILKSCKLIEFLQIATKGYYIYSNGK